MRLGWTYTKNIQLSARAFRHAGFAAAGVAALAISALGCSPGAVNGNQLRAGLKLPSAPGEVVAQPSDAKVVLIWAETPKADSYTIARSLNENGPFETLASGVTALTFTDSQVQNNVTYFYRVTPVTRTGKSGTPSDVVSTRPLPPPAGLAYTGTLPIQLTVGTALSPARTLSNAGGAIEQCAISPTLPLGMTLDSTTCALAGTPISTLAATVYTVVASNGAGQATTSFTLEVLNTTPSLAYPANPYRLTLGQASANIVPTSSGSTVTSCSINPALPTGLSLNAADCSITGSPSAITALATYTVTPLSGSVSSTTTITLAVDDAAPTNLSYAGSPFTLAQNVVMTNADSSSSGGAITGCSTTGLPAGLSVSLVSGKCRISGTPTTLSSAANYTITATNSGGSAQATVSIAVTVPPAGGFAGSPFTLTKGTAMTSATLTHSGGAFTACAGTLPAGLTIALSGSNCVISGTPTVISDATDYSVSGTTAGGTVNATATITVNDVAPTALTFAGATFSLTKSSAMTAKVTTHSGGPLTSCSGSGLPGGLAVSMSAGECRLSGTPTTVIAAADYSITGTNSGGSISTIVNITVNDIAPTVLSLTGSPFVYTKGTAISAVTGTHTGGALTGCTVSPTLPAGLSASVASGKCQLSGTPTAVTAQASYTFTGSNSGGSTTYAVSITVNDVAPSTPIGLSATAGVGSVTLSWTHVSNATDYTVYRKTSSGVTTSDTSACTATESGALSVTCTDSSATAGTTYYYAVLATNSGASSSLSSAVSATPYGAASRLAFTSQPANAVSGASIGSSVQVTVQDSGGRTVANSSLTISAALTSANGATLSGTLLATASSGVATFSGLSVDKAGSYTLTAAGGSLTGATSTSFTISAGSATQFAYSFGTSASINQSECTGPYTVGLKDTAGNTGATNGSGSAKAVPLTSSVGTLGIYGSSDSSCAGFAVTSVTIASAAASSGNFYVKNTATGAAVITAAGTNFGFSSLTATITSAAFSPKKLIAAGIAHTCAVINGGVKCWGREGFEGDPIPANSGVTSVSAGGYLSCAVMNGGLKCWGDNLSSQIKTITGPADYSIEVPEPVFAANSNVVDMGAGGIDDNGMNGVCAAINGGVQCWGINYDPTKVQVIPAGSGVTAVASESAYKHACAIVNGGVKCWGTNTAGQLGSGAIDTSPVSSPVQAIAASSGVTSLATGYLHTCAVVSGGLKCWGIGGVLGDGTSNAQLTPKTIIAASSGVTAVAAGHNTTCIIQSGGLKCWGENYYGQVGDGTTTARLAPVQIIASGSGVTAVTVGESNTCVIMSQGVKCWGSNVYNQSMSPHKGSVPTPTPLLGTIATATKVAINNDGGCAVVSGGVKCWGTYALSSASGVINETPVDVIPAGSTVTGIDVGAANNCAVVDGGVKCWGMNSYGEVGDGTQFERATPVTAIAAGSGATAVSGGLGYTCAVVSGGLKCWGSNYGNFGTTTPTTSYTPYPTIAAGSGVTAVAAGSDHTCAVISGGVKCWGSQATGRLGNGLSGSALVETPVQAIPAGSGATSVSVGYDYSCAVVSSGVQCWGGNQYHQLGNGSINAESTPIQVIPAGSGVTAVTTGDFHACALMNGGVKCWGSNLYNTLGDGTLASASTPTQIIAASSGVTALASRGSTNLISVGGALYAWGYNEWGQLGTGFPWITSPYDIFATNSGFGL